jgi:hypothetical protein
MGRDKECQKAAKICRTEEEWGVSGSKMKRRSAEIAGLAPNQSGKVKIWRGTVPELMPGDRRRYMGRASNGNRRQTNASGSSLQDIVFIGHGTADRSFTSDGFQMKEVFVIKASFST